MVTIETDAGITGIGEGGAKDTVEQCAAMIIGEDPTRIDHLWQMMMRGYFYPAGREKLDALGALDLALWDIKGKALGVPVYELLGGLARDHVECYATGYPSKGTLDQTARACVEAGFRAFRYAVKDPSEGGAFQSHEIVRQTAADCKLIRQGVGASGDWAIDFHTRLDMPDAIRLSSLIEDLEPYFCEDLVRSENPGVYRQLREHVKVPIAVGEQFGYKWDANELIENQLIDYARVTIPNVGGITEYMKICALVRDALRWADSAFHRSHWRGCASPRLRCFFGSGVNGDDRRRTAEATAPFRSVTTFETESSIRTAARVSASRSIPNRCSCKPKSRSVSVLRRSTGARTVPSRTGEMLQVVAALIERDGLILIGQRPPGKSHPLRWEFPGGKVEAGETLRDALVRELREELEINAEIGREMDRYLFGYAGREPIELIFFEVSDYLGEPVNQAFHEIRWIAWDQLQEYPFLEGDAPFIARLSG